MSMFEQQAKRNMAMFEEAMKLFMPALKGAQPGSAPANPMMEFQAETLANMQAQMAAIQKQLSDLYSKD